jgi:hypothetical protein
MIGLMEKKQLASIAAGGLTILLGILVLVGSILPPGSRLVSWPLIVVGVGAAFLLFGFGTSAAGLVIPGAIVSGIGCLLYVQHLTGWWHTWAFAWTLIPGFTGLGLLALDGLLGGRPPVRTASRILLISSAALFLVFAAAFSRQEWSWILLGVALVSAGVVLVIRNVRPRPNSTRAGH